MPTAKDAHALVSYFAKAYKSKYDRVPSLNRYSARWVFDAILTQMSGQEAESLVDYYFTTSSGDLHSFSYFSYNYEKLIDAQDAAVKDKARQDQIREETRLRTERWNQRLEQHRSESN